MGLQPDDLLEKVQATREEITQLKEKVDTRREQLHDTDRTYIIQAFFLVCILTEPSIKFAAKLLQWIRSRVCIYGCARPLKGILTRSRLCIGLLIAAIWSPHLKMENLLSGTHIQATRSMPSRYDQPGSCLALIRLPATSSLPEDWKTSALSTLSILAMAHRAQLASYLPMSATSLAAVFCQISVY